MTGLRERQKADRREAILNSAMYLFERKGFEQTTIQEIAERAKLTVPTVYRYFRSKTEFLLGMHEKLMMQLEQDGEKILNDLPSHPVDAITEILCAQLDLNSSASGSNIQIWRTITSEVVKHSDLFREVWYERDQRLVLQLKRVCARLVLQKQLDANTDIDCTAELLNLIVRGAFRMRVGSERGDDEIRNLIKVSVAALYNGFRPDISRSHSVRPPILPLIS